MKHVENSHMNEANDKIEWKKERNQNKNSYKTNKFKHKTKVKGENQRKQNAYEI